MTITNNPIDYLPPLSLAAMQRRRQTPAFQAWQRSSQATAPLAEEEPTLKEESSLAPNPDEPNDTYDPEDTPLTEDYEPASTLASTPPTLDELALHGCKYGDTGTKYGDTMEWTLLLRQRKWGQITFGC
jgi:hypothetical protein